MKATLPSSFPATCVAPFHFCHSRGHSFYLGWPRRGAPPPAAWPCLHVRTKGVAAGRTTLSRITSPSRVLISSPAGTEAAWAEAGQRAFVAGAVRRQAAAGRRTGADRHRHRAGSVRVVTRRSRRGRASDRSDRGERTLAMALDALGVGAVERQSGEELGRPDPPAGGVE